MKKENLVILIPISIVLTGIILGVCFYIIQINKQNSIEKQQKLKIETEKEAKELEEEKKETQKKQQELDLNSCLGRADNRYIKAWNNECEFLGKLSKKCKELLDLEYSKYLEKYNMTPEDYAESRDLEKTDFPNFNNIMDYYERKDNCSCRLPISKADGFGEDLNRWKNECYIKYPVIK